MPRSLNECPVLRLIITIKCVMIYYIIQLSIYQETKLVKHFLIKSQSHLSYAFAMSNLIATYILHFRFLLNTKEFHE